MYSEDDLNAAVASGAMTRDAANALRDHARKSALAAPSAADEENFKLIASFNDVFVVLASLLLFGAAGSLAGPLAVAAAAWGLAEFFTLKRRMALPSIVYNGVFVGAVALFMATTFGLAINELLKNSTNMVLLILGTCAVAAGAAAVFYARFRVPVGIAMIVAPAVWGLYAVFLYAFPKGGQWLIVLLLLLGLATFAFAMWWDAQDRERRTDKADVAFWLHLLSSPMIVHAVFLLAGYNFATAGLRGSAASAGVPLAILAVALYVALGIVAVVIDRRAMLVSAMIYVITAMVYLFSQIGNASTAASLAVLLIAGNLLLLSAFWQQTRRTVLSLLPERVRALVPLAP
jgi:hypothetical protein